MLESGEQFGRYEIRSQLGAGGMGEVYLAQDTALNRNVAIKLLNDGLCENQEHLRRFRQEARAASALNHPNIVTIYEIGESNQAQCFIAMEFVEGSNLRRLLEKRKIRLKEALDIAIQTASALAAAHAASIVHRDIKPENIVRRPDGLVKILDFGLAKQTIFPVQSGKIDSEAITQAKISTMPGTIMGTPQYMSPEQIRGKPIDVRTDIWSLGVVLYEMITGSLPFDGETRTDVLAAILQTDPRPLSVYKPNVPVELEHIVKKALGKDCEQRYQVVKDLHLDLKLFQSELDSSIEISKSGSFLVAGASATHTQTESHLKSKHSVTSGRRLWLTTSALVFLLAAFFGYYSWRQYQPAKTNYSASLLASSQITSWKSDLGESAASRARLSPPDGKLVAYVASNNGINSIWLKQIGGGGEPFTFAQDDSTKKSPIFSSDGERIAYISERGERRGIWTS
nr:serine/threonine-protein kinase [Acidobacteriota bacterium]